MDQPLVTIDRGGKQIVKVVREATPGLSLAESPLLAALARIPRNEFAIDSVRQRRPHDSGWRFRPGRVADDQRRSDDRRLHPTRCERQHSRRRFQRSAANRTGRNQRRGRQWSHDSSRHCHYCHYRAWSCHHSLQRRRHLGFSGTDNWHRHRGELHRHRRRGHPGPRKRQCGNPPPRSGWQSYRRNGAGGPQRNFWQQQRWYLSRPR